MKDPRDFVPITPVEIQGIFGNLSRWTFKKLGQHFLCDRNLRDAIIRDAEIKNDEIILEIGTGLGVVTAGLLSTGVKVISVEVDKMIYTLARDFMRDSDNLILLNEQALSGSSLSEPVIAALEKEIKANPDAKLKLVANLPYNIATKVITAIMECKLANGRQFNSLTVMVQKEVAQRLTAESGSKDFAYQTVLCKVHGDFKKGRFIKPIVFFPPPKVDSMLIHADLHRKPLEQILDYKYFKEYLHCLFLHRRKYALKSLKLCTARENAAKLTEIF